MISSKLTTKLSSRVPLKRGVAISEIASQASPDRNDNRVRGFTLIELLVAIVVIGTFGTIIVNILTSILRGTNKTDAINTVRQNGNYAISQMQKTIAFAKSFDGASNNGVNWTCDIAPAPPVQYKEVKITSFDGTISLFSCQAETITANAVSLMDADPAGKVLLSPGSCFFTCRKESVFDSPTVGINFTLTARTNSQFVEKQATIPFKTSIKVRN